MVGKRSTVSVVVAAALLVASGPHVATAAAARGTPEPSEGSGSDITALGPEGPLTPQAADKVAATRAYAKALATRDFVAAKAADSAYKAKWGASGQTQSESLVAAPTSRILGVAQVGQNKSYYCGPASGYMMIRYLHGAGFTSRYDGTAPGQAGLANANHMRTDINGSTDWSTKYFPRGVNRWRGVNWYVQVDSPSSTLVPQVFTHSIGGNGMPLAADTVEFAGGAHYNGHPVSKTIGHWIVGYGYASSGATGYWADPSTTVWSTAKPTFSYSSSGFTKFLQSNGILY